MGVILRLLVDASNYVGTVEASINFEAVRQRP
jgi:hypothetical protein